VTKPMGRPKIENPKETQLGVRLNTDELRKLDENAQHYNETRTQSLRRGIEVLNQAIKSE
jgi:hypothetical protein